MAPIDEVRLFPMFNFFRRVNPNTKGVDGWTALEIAATSGVIEIVQILLADKRTQFLSGSTRGSPLHLAA